MQKQVKLLRRKGQVVLVEYQDEDNTVQKTIVSAKEVVEENGVSYCTQEVLDQGIPYGIPWEVLLPSFTITPTEIARQLRDHGIWTVEDWKRDPKAVVGAVNSCVVKILAEINRLVKNQGGSNG